MGQLDSSIILGVQPVQIDPFRAIAQGQALRLQREQAEALAEERQAIAEQRRAQTDKLQRDAQHEAEGDAAYDELISTWGADPSKPMPAALVGRLYRGYGPERGSALVKGLLDIVKPPDLTNAANLAQSVRTRLAGLASIKDPTRQKAAYEAVAQDYIRAGVVKPEEIEPWTPTIVNELAERMRANQPAIKVGNGDTLAKERPDGSFETVYTAPQGPRPRNFQSKDVLLDGRPSMVNFDTTTGRYF